MTTISDWVLLPAHGRAAHFAALLSRHRMLDLVAAAYAIAYNDALRQHRATVYHTHRPDGHPQVPCTNSRY